MPLYFNTLLRSVKIEPSVVRLLRHKDQRSSPGRSPYELWRNEPEAFQAYQGSQNINSRKKFSTNYWAVFIADPFNDTMFAGLYRVKYRGLLGKDRESPHIVGQIDPAGSCDMYDLKLSRKLRDLIGRLFIDWGDAKISWVQYADRQDKVVLELRPTASEPPFPGLLNFMQPLSRIGKLPLGWIEVLRSTRGVYLLTCPRTREQYVGSADRPGGFWGRWMEYFNTGHGGNLGLKSRDPSDYQVSILEVAGSADDHQAVLTMEGRWQKKLRSREMGLNRNLAKR
jgi:hypothetical protein